MVADARARLVEERAAVQQRLVQLRASFADIVAAAESSNVDDEHDPEGVTIAFERSQLQALIRQAEQRLEEIEQSLGDLHAGTYGVCRSCGRQIPPERLEVRPTATLCVACAARQ